MPAQPFSVHPNLDELARQNLAVSLTRVTTTGSDTDADQSGTVDTSHHGARDPRQAARGRSDRAHAGRAAGAASGRSYAFRRS